GCSSVVVVVPLGDHRGRLQPTGAGTAQPGTGRPWLGGRGRAM
ncbi:MAG: hypothetical protein AVDCRST_MAG72-1204, partial [uncultured Nocardioidaceae bacterium]